MLTVIIIMSKRPLLTIIFWLPIFSFLLLVTTCRKQDEKSVQVVTTFTLATRQLTRTVEPTITATLHPTKTPSPTSPPTTTPTPVLTNTPVPLPNVPETFNEMENWLVNHWQQQTDPDLIYNTLYKAGWVTTSFYIPMPFPNGANVKNPGWNVFDLNGDGSKEWIIALKSCDQDGRKWQNDPDCERREQSMPLGDLWIINEDGLVYSTYADQLDAAPVAIIQADLTGDGIPDLVTIAQSCSISCFPAYQIITGHFGQIEDAIHTSLGEQKHASANSAYMLGSGASAEDVTGDGISDLILYGGVFYSAGAEPQRWRTDIWSWDGQEVSLYDSYYDPIEYIVHALYYANELYADHNFRLAAPWYKRILHDETLGESYTNGTERDKTRQFAAFRLVLLHLQQNDEAEAKLWQDWLNVHFPNEPLTHAASLLISEWESTSQWIQRVQTCETVTAYLNEEDDKIKQETDCVNHDGSKCGLLAPIEVVDTYGVNPHLLVSDVCVLP